MSKKYAKHSRFLQGLVFGFWAENAAAYSPPASLPIEPASPDEEIISQGEQVEIDIERPEPLPAPKPDVPKPDVPKPKSEVRETVRKPQPSRARPRTIDERVEDIQRQLSGEEPVYSRPSRTVSSGMEKSAPRYSLSPAEPGAGDFSAQARMSLNVNGFGGNLKLVQYPKSWLGVTETARYFKNEDEDRAFLNRRGVLVGIELHPYRSAFISPFLDLQGGGEFFEREGEFDDVKSAVVEAAAGVELRLTHFASIVAQWTEAYYPGLKDQLFFPSKKNKDPKRFQTAEVLFNLKWEKKLF